MCGVKIDKISGIGGGRHLRFTALCRDMSFECVFFSHTESELGVEAGDTVDIAFTPQINEYRLRSSVQLQIAAVRKHDPRPMCKRLLDRAYQLPVSETAPYCPDRSAFVSVWRKLQSAGGSVAADLEGLIRQCPRGIEPERFCICLIALCELGLLHKLRPDSLFGARIVSNTPKVNLDDSPLIKRLKARF